MNLTRRRALAGAGAAIIAGAAPRSAWSATEADVIIIGAGLAGLNAARLLEAGGARVSVIEAEQRVGGRLHTFDDLPGRPEAGGVQVGQSYARLRAIATERGVAVVPGGNEPSGALFRINGKSVAAADWPTSPANRLGPDESRLVPSMLGPAYAARLPRLDAPDRWTDEGAIARFDRPYATVLRELGASDEARRLIAANFNGNALDTMSALHIARSMAIFRAGAGPVMTITGGSQRLPEAMAHALKNEVRLGHKMRGIMGDADGARVMLANGRTLAARHVICTIPFAAMRGMAIDAQIDPALAALHKTLPYTRASFAYLAAKTPFWKEDGLPDTIWSDEAMLARVFVLGDDPAMLKVWVSGRAADAIDRMPDAVAGTRMIAAIEAARPAARGQLRLLRRFSWSREASARGIYHHIGVGQGALLASAVRAEGQTVHFAGEHLARTSSGMEGALESGERVARLILAKL